MQISLSLSLFYMLFPDASLLDVAKAIELFPRFNPRTADDKTRCIVFSCFLRVTQGLLAIIAVFLLVMTSSDVIEIVLNFTAVNFISQMDEVAFILAKSGKYGTIYEQAAKDIEQEPLPTCINRKRKHIRYRHVMISIATVLFVMLSYIGFSQESNTHWITNTLKVEFEDTTELQLFNGCYDIDVAVSYSKRYNYIYSNDDTNQIQFGYCKKSRRWVLFKSGNDDPCEAEEGELAHSSKTDSFDITTSFDEAWYSAYNTPLDLFFFDLGENQDKCSSFDDGICDDFFNKFEFQYDDGDCCAATCTQSHCGKGALDNSLFFDTNITSGDGFPTCIDRSMVPVTIRLDQVIISSDQNDTSSNGNEEQNLILKLDCDEYNVFSINATKSMETKNETVMVNDGANCTFIIEELSHNDTDLFWDVEYSVFYDHGVALYHGGQSNNNKTNDGSFSVCKLIIVVEK